MMSKSKSVLSKKSAKEKEWRWDLLVAILIIVSVIVVFIDYLFPLTETDKLYLRVIDLASIFVLLYDYTKRLRVSKSRKNFMMKHWYEIPAMMPLFITGAPEIASAVVLNYIRFIALFRLVRLYNLWTYIKGGELLILATLSSISIIFGALGIYITEAENSGANITTLNDAFWWSIETITTVAYGEYYPVTDLGKIVATIMMFAAIGFLWTFVGLLGSSLVSKKTKEEAKEDSNKAITVIDETKDIIKKRIETVEDLDPNELEDLIRIIRTLNSATS